MEIENLPMDKKIILFDGVCNLCDTSVQFIYKHDKKDIFRFVAIQSELGQKIINHIKVDDMQRSSDGTVKNAVRLHDGLVVEDFYQRLRRRTNNRIDTIRV